MNITVIGTGFVGVVTAAVFASLGHKVTGLDIDDARIKRLHQGILPFYEPKLDDLVQKGLNVKTLSFTTSYAEAIPHADYIFICVGTPSSDSGAVDLRFVEAALTSLAPHLSENAVIIIKSTVPPGSFTRFDSVLKRLTKTSFSLASIPEFLREGSAVQDTLHPSRIVIGTDSSKIFNQLEELHKPLQAPILHVSPASAQMGKYAANAYLATRITFINQIADLCQKNGADIEEVIQTMGYDERIGSHYWYPGLGYGGSCFPKDVKELAYFSRQVGHGNNWFNVMQKFNEDRIPTMLQRLTETVGDLNKKQVAILGLAFKPQTDDTRESPAEKVIAWLVQAGANVTVYDPKAHLPPQFKKNSHVTQANSIPEACHNSNGILVLTEWPEITSFDFSLVRETNTIQWIFDTRNRLNGQTIQQLGFQYLSIGRMVEQ